MDRVRVLELLRTSQRTDKILSALPHRSSSFVHRTRRNYTLHHDALYYHGRPRKGTLLVVPQHSILDTIEHQHNAIHHQGTAKTWYEISIRYHGIPKRIVSYMLRQCTVCHTQAPNQRPAPIQPIVSQQVMERIQMDLIDMRQSPDGDYKWILHIKDHFSRFCMLYPLRHDREQEVMRCILEWIAILGPPAILQTDYGAAFANEPVTRLAHEHRIQICHGSSGRPRSQGLVERANGHVRRLVSKWCRRFHDPHWAQSLPSIAMACNMSLHATLGRSPFEVVFSRPPVRRDVPPGKPVGQNPESSPDVRLKIAAAQDRMVRAWDRRHGYVPFRRGTHVSVAVHGSDRAPLDAYRIPGIVVGHKRRTGYRVCTAHGVLRHRVAPRHVLRLPDGQKAPEAAEAYAASWRDAPRVSIAQCR